jgi:hypothetical protein
MIMHALATAEAIVQEVTAEVDNCIYELIVG